MNRRPRTPIREIRRRRGRDLVLLGLSLYVAYGIMHSGVVADWIASADEYVILASFVAGIFFTSLFTLAPAIAAIIELSHIAPLSAVAIPGALGAVVGDLLLFLFLRDFVISSMGEMISRPWRQKWRALLRHPLLQWIIPAFGLILYTVPFVPDEVGLSMMGLSRLRLAILIPLTFVVNIISITILWYGVRAFGV